MRFKKLKDMFQKKSQPDFIELKLPEKETLSDLDERERENYLVIARDYEDKGFEQFNSSLYEEAISYWKEGLEAYLKVGETGSMACMLTNIGTAYRFLGKHETALQCYEKAMELDRESSDSEGILQGLLNIGGMHRHLGNIDNALAHFQAGYSESKSTKNLPLMGSFLENIGYCLMEQTKYDNAVDSFHELIKISEEADQVNMRADALRGLIEVYTAMAEYDSLLEILAETVDLYNRMDTQDVRWRMLFSLMNTYTMLGFHHEANEIRKLLSGDKIRDLPPAFLSTYSLIYGNYCLVFGDFNTGLDYVQNALEICEQEFNPKKTALAYNYLAQLLMYLGQHSRGIECGKQSLKISVSAKNRFIETLNYIVLSKLTRKTSQVQELSRYASEALSKSVPLARPELTWQAHHCMGMAFHEKKEYKKAFRQYYNALKLLDEIITRIPDENLHRDYLMVPCRMELFSDITALVKVSGKKTEIDNVLKELRSAPMYETLTGQLSG